MRNTIKLCENIMISRIMITQFAKNLRSLRSKRAAVLPYTFIKDKNTGKYELWVLLAVHAKSGEITDLGGGVKKTESDLEAAYRELNEESNGIFSQIVSIENLEMCISVSRLRNEKVIPPLKTKVYVEGITSIFLPLDPSHIETSIPNFEATKTTKTTDDEIKNLVWVRGIDILQPTKSTYKMWGFIRKFYYEALCPELLEMLYVSWVHITISNITIH